MISSNDEKGIPRFSILISVYNSESTLRRCLDSVLNQSFHNFEVVVVDDASTDGSYAILQDYADIDDRIKVIKREKNDSLLSARIAAMRKSVGEYILLLDSDDYYVADACRILDSKLRRNETEITEFSYICEPKKRVVINKLRYDRKNVIKEILKQEWPHTVWNKCYSRELVNTLLNNAETFYCNMTEDVYFSVLFFYYAKSYQRISDVLYHYNSDNGMSTSKHMRASSIENACISIRNKTAALKSFLEKNNPQIVNLVDIKEKLDIEEMALLCCRQQSPISDRIELLKCFDEIFETNYLNRFEAELIKAYEVYDGVVHHRKKEGLKVLIKESKKYFFGK